MNFFHLAAVPYLASKHPAFPNAIISAPFSLTLNRTATHRGYSSQPTSSTASRPSRNLARHRRTLSAMRIQSNLCKSSSSHVLFLSRVLPHSAFPPSPPKQTPSHLTAYHCVCTFSMDSPSRQHSTSTTPALKTPSLLWVTL